MTRLSTTAPTPIRKPESVSLGELAIAAGLAGRPVAVCFSESTATITSEMWKYFTQFTGPGQVLHVHGQTDVSRLTKDVGQWRLVVVHAPRLFNTVAWTVRMHGSEASALPTIFSRSIPSAVDDVPIPMLVLRNTPDESSAIVRWLTAGSPQRAVLPEEWPENGIAFDPALIPRLTGRRAVNMNTIGSVVCCNHRSSTHPTNRWINSPSTWSIAPTSIWN